MRTDYEDTDGDGEIETDANQTGMIRVTGTGSDEVITATSSNDSGQIHVYAGLGEDVINMDFTNSEAFQKGHHVRGDTDSGAVRDADTFNFRNYSNVSGIIVGRIEDFDYSRDTIMIDGIPRDLKVGLPPNAKIVEYDANPDDSATEMQQWLLIDTGSGFLFYALEGARVITSGFGANGNQQEDHFINYERDANGVRIRDANDNIVPSITEATLQDLFDNHAVTYIEHNNYVPDGHTAQGGNTRNDYDAVPSDVLDVIDASENGDLIAAGLNDDVVNANGGNDYVWGGSGDDTINGGSGDDTLEGGTGNDTLDGGSGADTFAFSSGHGNDVIENFNVNEDQITFNGSIVDLNAFLANSSVVFNSNGAVVTLGAGVTVVLAGLENFDTSGPVDPPSDYNLINGGDGDDKGQTKLKGTSGNDSIDGGTGNDQLLGNDGNDILIGGDGQDTLTGGSGEDVFVLAAGSRDTIKDFSLSDDKIDLTSFVNVGSIDDLTFNEQGDHLRIKVGGSDVSHLEDFLRNGFTIADLTDDHFIFG